MAQCLHCIASRPKSMTQCSHQKAYCWCAHFGSAVGVFACVAAATVKSSNVFPSPSWSQLQCCEVCSIEYRPAASSLWYRKSLIVYQSWHTALECHAEISLMSCMVLCKLVCTQMCQHRSLPAATCGRLVCRSTSAKGRSTS